MIDHIRSRTINEKEMQAELARMEMIEALRKGNIDEVKSRLPEGISIRDFEQYMSNQWRLLKGHVIQDYQIYSNKADARAPELVDFSLHSEKAVLSEEQRQALLKGMTSFRGNLGKGKAGSVEVADKPMTETELGSMAEETLSEWESFMGDTWTQILDAQMMQNYESRMAEVKQEVDKIIALAKAGKISAEFVLIALAKVNVVKNGVLMSGLGKKAYMTNQEMNKISAELAGVSATDPAKLQEVQAKTRDGAFNLQMIVSDLQKVMQDVAGVLEQVHSMIGEINRTKREMIQKVGAN